MDKDIKINFTNFNKVNNIVYKIDRNYNIIDVNEEWDRFARENNGDKLTSEKIIGKNILDFITSKEVKQIYIELIEFVKKGNTVKYPFRCDSPTIERRFLMTVSLDEGGNIKFVSEMLSNKSRKLPLNVTYVSEHKDEYIVMCAWCKSVRVGNKWIELDEALNSEKLFEQLKFPLISHGICEKCYALIKSELASNH